MIPTRHLVLLAGLIGLCAMGVAMVTAAGLTLPRPQRAVLRGARAAAHEEIERLETLVPAGRAADDSVWRVHLAVVDKELEHGHVDVAVRVWHDAYAAALDSRSWEGMIAVGDAFMAIGRAAGAVRGARMNAREAYLTALIQARRERSVDGVLRSAQAFRELGEGAIAEQCLHIAGQLAVGDDRAQERIREARQHWAAVTEF